MDGKTDQAVALMKQLKVYPLAKAADPPKNVGLGSYYLWTYKADHPKRRAWDSSGLRRGKSLVLGMPWPQFRC